MKLYISDCLVGRYYRERKIKIKPLKELDKHELKHDNMSMILKQQWCETYVQA